MFKAGSHRCVSVGLVASIVSLSSSIEVGRGRCKETVTFKPCGANYAALRLRLNERIVMSHFLIVLLTFRYSAMV